MKTVTGFVVLALALLICGNSRAQTSPPTPAPATTPTPANNAAPIPIFVQRDFFAPQEIRPDYRNVWDRNVAESGVHRRRRIELCTEA
ncbi:MAG: hypothetical protein WA734_07505 [Candidatus Acidiferrales bacterium]